MGTSGRVQAASRSAAYTGPMPVPVPVAVRSVDEGGDQRPVVSPADEGVTIEWLLCNH